MPDSCDSIGYGTTTSSASPQLAGGVAVADGRASKSHVPLRLVQSSRVSCGRGYSGSGLSASTSFAHLVVSWYVEALSMAALNSGTASPSTVRSPSPSYTTRPTEPARTAAPRVTTTWPGLLPAATALTGKSVPSIE